jgi:hypothetical protein
VILLNCVAPFDDDPFPADPFPADPLLDVPLPDVPLPDTPATNFVPEPAAPDPSMPVPADDPAGEFPECALPAAVPGEWLPAEFPIALLATFPPAPLCEGAEPLPPLWVLCELDEPGTSPGPALPLGALPPLGSKGPAAPDAMSRPET